MTLNPFFFNPFFFLDYRSDLLSRLLALQWGVIVHFGFLKHSFMGKNYLMLMILYSIICTFCWTFVEFISFRLLTKKVTQ